MDLRNIKTFVKVAELSSISKTAVELNYAQSTVTMQIKQLEKELGYPVFDRIGKSISLTDRGKQFLYFAYEILHSMEKAQSIDDNPKNVIGSLRIGVSESLLFGVLIDFIPSLKEQYPKLELQIKTGHTTQLLEQLKQNELDIVYISQSINTDPNLRCYYTRKEELIFLCGANHPAAKRKNMGVSELFEYEFLATEKEGICYRRLLELAAQNNCVVKDSIEVDNVQIIIQLIRANVGLGFLPKYAVEKHLTEKSLVKVDVDLDEQIYYSQILCHKNRWLSPFMEKFIELIKTNRP